MKDYGYSMGITIGGPLWKPPKVYIVCEDNIWGPRMETPCPNTVPVGGISMQEAIQPAPETSTLWGLAYTLNPKP